MATKYARELGLRFGKKGKAVALLNFKSSVATCDHGFIGVIDANTVDASFFEQGKENAATAAYIQDRRASFKPAHQAGLNMSDGVFFAAEVVQAERIGWGCHSAAYSTRSGWGNAPFLALESDPKAAPNQGQADLFAGNEAGESLAHGDVVGEKNAAGGHFSARRAVPGRDHHSCWLFWDTCGSCLIRSKYQ